MPTLTTQIEIAAPPGEVRKVFLDFTSYPQWSKTHLQSLAVTSGDPQDLKEGDTLKVQTPGFGFGTKVMTNTHTEFRWLGSLPFIFSGEHFFQFQDSETTKGGTTLVQGEMFTGALACLVRPGSKYGEQTRHGFAAFNGELKRRVEGRAS